MHIGSYGEFVRFGPYSFDPETGDLYRGESPVLLPPQPTKILCLLARHAGSIVSRSRIRDELWDKAPPDPDQAINSAIAEIRSALGDDARDPEYIQTVPRKGYRLLVDRPTEHRPEELRPAGDTQRVSGKARVATLFGITAGVVLLGLWLLTGNPGDNRSHRIAVVPARVVDADSQTDSLARQLTDRLVTALTVAESAQIEIVRYHWDMKFDRENGLITRGGRNMNVDYLVESSVDRDGEWEVSASVYSVEDGTQLWYRRYNFPLQSSGRIVDIIAGEIDSLLIRNLNAEVPRVTGL